MTPPNFKEQDSTSSLSLSETARERIVAPWWERMFFASWKQVLMIHFEVDATALQRTVPFKLDLWQDRAFVSLVAFTMRGMRPAFGGKVAARLVSPVATHEFLNVRTYVRHRDEPGIHFIAEWLNNRLAAQLGPLTFGLPYHCGRIEYRHDAMRNELEGRVTDERTSGKLSYRASLSGQATFQLCIASSLDEWLMERYIAFNSAGSCPRSFRVWHPPWPQCEAKMDYLENTLPAKNWPWFRDAKITGANYSPGFDEVWMGRPHFCGRSIERARRFPHGAFFGEPG